MPAVQDVARITTKSKEHKTDAGLVWTRLHEIAKKSGKAEPHDGKQGRRVQLYMSEVVKSLFVGLESEDLETLARQIRTDLRAGNNAVCLESHQGQKPTWWVADAFTPAAETTRVVTRKPETTTRAEKKLTAKEAGEDREPAPVTTKHVTQSGAVYAVPVLEVLSKYDEPLTGIEICVVLGVPLKEKTGKGKLPSVNTQVKSALDSLLGLKQIFARLETHDERRIRAGVTDPSEYAAGRAALLFSTKRKVPARVTRDLVGYTLETSLVPRNATIAASARKREARNQKVLNALMEVGRPMTAERLGALVGMAASTASDACKDLREAGLVHTNVVNRSRYWAAIDVPLTTSASSPKKEKPDVTIATPTASATETGIILAAQQLSGEFSSVELAAASGRSNSACNDTIRNHPDIFERVGTRNRFNVYRVKGQNHTPVAVQSPPVSPAPAPAGSSDLLDQVRALVASEGQSERIRELEAENADLRERLAKANKALRAMLEE